jgi:hypothetical protein
MEPTASAKAGEEHAPTTAALPNGFEMLFPFFHERMTPIPQFQE